MERSQIISYIRSLNPEHDVASLDELTTSNLLFALFQEGASERAWREFFEKELEAAESRAARDALVVAAFTKRLFEQFLAGDAAAREDIAEFLRASPNVLHSEVLHEAIAGMSGDMIREMMKPPKG